MKTFFAALGTVAMLVTGTLATATPASADGYYRHHRGYYDGGRRGYYDGGRRYYRGYDGGRRYHHRGHGDALAAGAVGLGVGALIGGALAAPRAYDNGYYGRGGYIVNEGPVNRAYRPAPVYRGGYNHVDACFARYRSYDPRSDTFIGYDGNAYRCNL